MKGENVMSDTTKKNDKQKQCDAKDKRYDKRSKPIS